MDRNQRSIKEKIKLIESMWPKNKECNFEGSW